MPSTVSRVDIANRALFKLGERRITSLAEEGNAPETLNDMFDIVRDAEIEAHPWNFSKVRAQLSADPTAPAFGYSYRYRLPADFIRLIQFGEFGVYYDDASIAGARFRPSGAAGAPYDIEGDFIVTNHAAPLNIIYGARIEDTTIYPPTFIEALASRLAYEGCQAITDSNALQDRIEVGYGRALRTARNTNAIVRPPQPLPAETSWTRARRSI